MHLQEVRAALFERHRAGAGGIEIVHALTAAVDDLMRALYRYAEEQHSQRYSRLNQRLAIVARGGYGRRS